MVLNTIFKHALIGALAVVLVAPSGVFAQTAQVVRTTESMQTFSRAELDQMLAPVALYSDSLLAQVLIAATYPSQVVEADRWVKENKGLGNDQLNAALDGKDWDLSVKALVPFPQVLAMMDEHLDWTTALGEAFLGQQREVMSEVQLMRQKAYAAGNLKSTEQQRVIASAGDIEIQPANPEVVYVPYYDPGVIYGNWWWPDYPPYAWYPFGSPYVTVGLFGFGWGIGVSPYWDWCWGRWNWGGGDVFINVDRTVNINNRNLNFSRNNLRTANLTRAANRGVADPVRSAALTHGGRAAAGRPAQARLGAAAGQGRAGAVGRAGMAAGNFARRPSVASVTRGLRGGGTAMARGTGSRGANFTGRGANFARGGASRSSAAPRLGSVPNSGSRSFAGAGVASRAGGHGLARSGGGARFGGGAPRFGGGARSFSGGANLGGRGFAGAGVASRAGGQGFARSGGGARFGGGAPRFGGGARSFSGGASFGGRGFAGAGVASRAGGHGFARSGGGARFGGGAPRFGGGGRSFGGGASFGGRGFSGAGAVSHAGGQGFARSGGGGHFGGGGARFGGGAPHGGGGRRG